MKACGRDERGSMADGKRRRGNLRNQGGEQGLSVLERGTGAGHGERGGHSPPSPPRGRGTSGRSSHEEAAAEAPANLPRTALIQDFSFTVPAPEPFPQLS